jgi:NADH-quinone oxidoreductase subunit J
MLQSLALPILLLAAVMLYGLFPRGLPGMARWVSYGAGLGAVLLLWFLWDPVPERPGITATTYLVGTVTVAAAAQMIVQRSPVASALWFAVAVVGSAVLMFAAGAQFLATATVLVYAGAVIVMFLFVLMLAQQEGWAPCDRETLEPGLAVVAFLLLGWPLLWVAEVYPSRTPQPYRPGTDVYHITEVSRIRSKASHVAGLGAALYAEQGFAIEIAGTALLVALVGAVLMATRRVGEPTGQNRFESPPAPALLRLPGDTTTVQVSNPWTEAPRRGQHETLTDDRL